MDELHLYPNRKTGLSRDYLNNFYALKMILAAGKPAEGTSEIFKQPVPKYSEYYKRDWTVRSDEIIGNANPDALASLDCLVEEFNDAAIERKMDIEVLNDYIKRATEIIEGK